MKELVKVLKIRTLPRTVVAGLWTRRGRKSKIGSGGMGRGWLIGAGEHAGVFWVGGGEGSEGGEGVGALDMVGGVVGGVDGGVVEVSSGERGEATLSENCLDILRSRESPVFQANSSYQDKTQVALTPKSLLSKIFLPVKLSSDEGIKHSSYYRPRKFKESQECLVGFKNSRISQSLFPMPNENMVHRSPDALREWSLWLWLWLSRTKERKSRIQSAKFHFKIHLRATD